MRRRRNDVPRPPKPTSMSIQLAGFGTAATAGVTGPLAWHPCPSDPGATPARALASVRLPDGPPLMREQAEGPSRLAVGNVVTLFLAEELGAYPKAMPTMRPGRAD